MMDMKTFMNQMFTPGTVPCMIFGAVLGLIFAVLCLTIGAGAALVIALFCLIGAFIGGVKDKKARAAMKLLRVPGFLPHEKRAYTNPLPGADVYLRISRRFRHPERRS